MNEKGKTDILPILLIIGVLAIAGGYIALPKSTTGGIGGGGGTTGGLLTSNPSIVFSVLDGKTGQAASDAQSIRLYKDGILAGTATSASGTISNLDPSTTYDYIVLNTNGFTYYPQKGTVTTNPAGSKTQLASLGTTNNGTLSTDAWKNSVGAVTNQVAVGANDRVTVSHTFRLASTSNDANSFGMSGTNLCLHVDYNNSAGGWVSVKPIYNGQTLTTGCSQSFSLAAVDTTNQLGSINVELPIDVLKQNTDYTIYFDIEVNSSINPTTNQDLNYTILDPAYYANTRNTGIAQYETPYYRDPIANGTDVGVSNIRVGLDFS